VGIICATSILFNYSGCGMLLQSRVPIRTATSQENNLPTCKTLKQSDVAARNSFEFQRSIVRTRTVQDPEDRYWSILRRGACDKTCLEDFMTEFDEPGVAVEWEQYVTAVDSWRRTINSVPGAFASTNADSMWELQKNIPFPSSSAVPTLRLPLCFHLARGPEFGCSLTEDQLRNELIPEMNRYWAQAAIQWDLVDVIPAEWANDADGSRRSLEIARQDMQQLVRDPETGKMTNKGIRRKLFLEQLIPEASTRTNTYDVYLFDFIGEGSQGTYPFHCTAGYPAASNSTAC
jgi:hypothetical protein